MSLRKPRTVLWGARSIDIQVGGHFDREARWIGFDNVVALIHEYRKAHHESVREMIGHVWGERCTNDDMHWSTRRRSARVFYTFKALVCLLLHLHGSVHDSLKVDGVVAAGWDVHPIADSGDYGWTELQVDPRWWRWRIEVVYQ